MRQFNCLVCGKAHKAYGKNEGTARFCSRPCRDAWFLENAKGRITCEWCGERATNNNDGARFCSRKCSTAAVSGDLNPNWLNIPRIKTCDCCGGEYGPKPGGINAFVKGRFCSRECGWKGQKHLHGAEKPNWNPNARRKNRATQHAAWVDKVLTRDRATCQHCGVTGIEMHAHHLKSYRDHPELRQDVSNGITLCHRCHWTEHSKSDANGVNSGNTAPGSAGGNPEPSHGRKVVEGATTRGRAYRRVEANCAWCGEFISRPLSDMQRPWSACDRKCAAYHREALKRVNGSNSPTSAPAAS